MWQTPSNVALIVGLGMIVALLPSSPLGAVQAGVPLVDGEDPDWAVLIERNDSKFCSGSLIAPDAVLTAAHCLLDDDGNEVDVSMLTAIIGRGDLTDTSDGVERSVTDFALHPSYADDGSGIVSPHDIAVMRIDSAPADYDVIRIAETTTDVIPNPVLFGYGFTEVEGDFFGILPPDRTLSFAGPQTTPTLVDNVRTSPTGIASIAWTRTCSSCGVTAADRGPCSKTDRGSNILSRVGRTSLPETRRLPLLAASETTSGSRKRRGLTGLAAMCSAGNEAVQDGLANIGFETGDLTGWSLGVVTEEVCVTGADGFC